MDILNRNSRVRFHLSPLYLAIVAFCFSMTVGVLWEFFECAMDQFFFFDMQKDTIVHGIGTILLDPTGGNHPVVLRNITDVIVVQADGTKTALGLGGYLDIGLMDTMEDLFVNFIGALVFSIIGYFYVLSRGKGKFVKTVYSGGQRHRFPGEHHKRGGNFFMNFILVSPNFPETFRWFAFRPEGKWCHGIRSCDASYEELHPDLKNALTEYYRVADLGDYDDMVRAVGYFTFRYGKIDWIESNNEYWLEMDAALRTAFNITTGPQIRCHRGLEKQAGHEGDLPAGRNSLCPVYSRDHASRPPLNFIAQKVGYPVVVISRTTAWGPTPPIAWKTRPTWIGLLSATPPQVPYL